MAPARRTSLDPAETARLVRGLGQGQALGRRLAFGQRATWPRFGLGRVPWRGRGSGRGGSLVSKLGRRLPTLLQRHENGSVHLLLGQRGDQREPAVACAVRGLARAGLALALSTLAVNGLRHLPDRVAAPREYKTAAASPTRRATSRPPLKEDLHEHCFGPAKTARRLVDPHTKFPRPATPSAPLEVPTSDHGADGGRGLSGSSAVRVACRDVRASLRR